MWGGGGGGGGGDIGGGGIYEHKSRHILSTRHIVTTPSTEPYTVDSRYLEIEGTLKNSLRYPYFDISDL